MTKREPMPSQTGAPAHTELLLSGDFSSPAEVLAARTIDTSQKREILESWVRDLEAQLRNPDAGKLLKTVRQALASLDHKPRG